MMLFQMSHPVQEKQIVWQNHKSGVGYLEKFPFWELECPDYLNVADENHQVGGEGADDEYHLKC